MRAAAGSRLHALASSERGVTLIEVVVSAAILGIIVVGTFTAFDAANHLTSREQRVSQAQALAQQDLDRLRGLPVSQLLSPSLSTPRTVKENGAVFTIVSQAQANTETANSTCSNGARYIATTSQVSLGSTQIAHAESVIALPPQSGSLIVQVVDSNGNGVQNMAVSGSGPGSFSGNTDSHGCALFVITGGTYNVTVSQPGYVDKDGNTSPPASQQTTSVIDGASDQKTFYYDRAGQLNVTFATLPYGGSTTQSTSSDQVTLFNNNMTYPGFRWVGTVNQYVPTISAQNLFPFTSKYTFYAGSCSNDAPSINNSGLTDPTVLIPQGGSQSMTLTLPALWLTVWTGNSTSPGSPYSGATVVLTDLGCGGSPPSAGGSPAIKHTQTTNASGRLPYPGLPFGHYAVCAQNPAGTQHIQQSPVLLTSLTSATTVNLYLGSGTSGPCP
jgi:prepilin-type N-terminal cleavage/methylation domain-containing protein